MICSLEKYNTVDTVTDIAVLSAVRVNASDVVKAYHSGRMVVLKVPKVVNLTANAYTEIAVIPSDLTPATDFIFRYEFDGKNFAVEVTTYGQLRVWSYSATEMRDNTYVYYSA